MKNKFIETIKSLDGEVYNLSYHQKRYEDVLSTFGKKNFQNLAKYINPPFDGLYRCRIVYDVFNQSDINITYHKYKKKDIKTLKLVYDDLIDYRFKSLDRDKLDELFLKKEDCDDVLIIKNNFVTDTTIANIAFYDGNFWITPSNPLLKGTTRERLLDEGKIISKDIRVEDIYKYSKVALLNSMIDFDIISTNIRRCIC